MNMEAMQYNPQRQSPILWEQRESVSQCVSRRPLNGAVRQDAHRSIAAVIFGGMGPEHEASLSSARTVLDYLPEQNRLLVGMTKDGEWVVGEGAWEYLGWITELRVRQNEIRMAFRFDQAVEPFTTDDLDDHVWEFDVNRFETNRTHWSVKDVDLFEALRETGLGGDLKQVELRPESRALFEARRSLGSAVSATAEITPKVFHIPEGGQEPTLVAVMMPFSADFDEVNAAIHEACKDAGLRGQRVDNIWENEAIIQDVFSLIYRSSMVIVDFTSRNPNVFYETGIAHTLGRPVIPITQNAGDVPFDVRHNRFQLYDLSEEGLQELTSRLSSRLTTLSGR